LEHAHEPLGCSDQPFQADGVGLERLVGAPAHHIRTAAARRPGRTGTLTSPWPCRPIVGSGGDAAAITAKTATSHAVAMTPTPASTHPATASALADGRGSATIELVLATPMLVMLLLLAVAFGRLATARADVDGAARAAARAASVSRDPASAARAAHQAATATLGERRITCRHLTVATDTHQFAAGGWVAVDVTCTVGLTDLTLLRLPGSRTIHTRFVEPLDAFRGVSRGFGNSDEAVAANPPGVTTTP
jgi:TadE-like protein